MGISNGNRVCVSLGTKRLRAVKEGRRKGRGGAEFKNFLREGEEEAVGRREQGRRQEEKRKADFQTKTNQEEKGREKRSPKENKKRPHPLHREEGDLVRGFEPRPRAHN